MPRYMYGNMVANYDPDRGWLLFTANSYVTKDGKLVMGKGMALHVASTWPYLADYFGTQILAKDLHLRDYHILAHLKSKVAAFQVKRDWRLPAYPMLIEESVRMLDEWARANPKQMFNLNYPGIGNGRLDINQVEPMLVHLPDNVLIWRLR